MPVRFTCGKCSFQANVKDELGGKKIKCPKCGEAGVVGAVAPAAATVKKAKKSVPDDEENPFAGLGDPSKFGTEIDEEDEDYEELMEAIRPAKKKKGDGKKKPEKPVEEKMNAGVMAIVAIFALGGLGAMGAGAYYTMGDLFITKVVEAPKEFEKVHHLHGEFYFELPKDPGWTRSESPNKPGVNDWLQSKNGGITLRVEEDEPGSLIVRAVAGGMNITDASSQFGTPGADPLQPNANDPDITRSMHDRAESKFASYSGYEQSNVSKVDSGMGQGRISQISYTEGFSKLKGYRATFINGTTVLLVRCVGPEASFDKMKETYERCIKSLEGVEMVFQ